MIRITLTSFICSALFLFTSCGEEKVQQQASSTSAAVQSDSLSLATSDEVEEPINEDLGAWEDVINIDTITKEEFDAATTVYENSFIEDTTSFPKVDGSTNIKLKNGKVVTFTDFENPDDETDVRYYYYQGRLADRLYFVMGGYYEGTEGLLVQENGKIDTIYYSPEMSSDGSKFYSLYTEYGAMGDLGFYYYEQLGSTYYEIAKVVLGEEALIKEITWHKSDAVYCKVYSYKEQDEPNRNYTYLRFKRK